MNVAPAPATRPARVRQAHVLRAGFAALASAVLALWLVTFDQEAGRERVDERDGSGTAAADAPGRSLPPVARAPDSPAQAPSGAAGDAAGAASGAGAAAERAASSATEAAAAGIEAPATSAPATAPPADAPPADAPAAAAPDAGAEAAARDASGRDGTGEAPRAEPPKDDARKDDGPEDGAAARSRVAPAPLGRGYMVQLGVFSELDNALRLRDELAAQGYPANVQSRVVLGPFPDRATAAAAQARVRAERRIDGVIVPPRKR